MEGIGRLVHPFAKVFPPLGLGAEHETGDQRQFERAFYRRTPPICVCWRQLGSWGVLGFGFFVVTEKFAGLVRPMKGFLVTVGLVAYRAACQSSTGPNHPPLVARSPPVGENARQKNGRSLRNLCNS